MALRFICFLVIEIRGLEGRVLYTPKEGETLHEPLLQPGMEVEYSIKGVTQRTLVDRVYFHEGNFSYYPPGSKTPIAVDASSILDCRWHDNSKPEFTNDGRVYDVSIFLRGEVKARVLTQTSLEKAADVYLIDTASNEIYIIRKTTLQKLIKRKSASPRPKKPRMSILASFRPQKA